MNSRSIFTPEERDRIRQEILDKAKQDTRLSGGAITGSVTIGKEDKWSDIDLAFGVREEGSLTTTLEDFSKFVYDNYGCYDHLDVHSRNWIYRVFFLKNTLQVDIAFVHQDSFRALAPTFKLVFGEALEPKHNPPKQTEALVGWIWLYAFHVRSSFARGKFWQTEYYISAMRDNVFSLLCLAAGLPTNEGRGIDELPEDVKSSLENTLVSSLEPRELVGSFEKLNEVFLSELNRIDHDLANRIKPGVSGILTQVSDLYKNQYG